MVYEYQCEKCSHYEEFIMTLSDYENFKPEPCKECSGVMKRVFTLSQATRVFKPDWYRDIALDPIFITSKKHLKEECEKHGGYSRYIEDSFNRNF